MRSSLGLKHLTKSAMLSRRLVIFTEIARHPQGMNVYELSTLLNCGRRNIWYHTEPMINDSLIKMVTEKKNGRDTVIFHATPFGIDVIGKDIVSLGKLYDTLRTDAIAAKKE
jgi:hypothetical protein